MNINGIIWKVKKNLVPDNMTIEQASEFWDNHSVADYPSRIIKLEYIPGEHITFIEIEIQTPKMQNAVVTDDTLIVDLLDGRTISVPIAWYPRLLYGTQKERENWRLIGDGEGIHWPELDEDISVENILFGRHSGESQRSLEKWLEGRKKTEVDSAR